MVRRVRTAGSVWVLCGLGAVLLGCADIGKSERLGSTSDAGPHDAQGDLPPPIPTGDMGRPAPDLGPLPPSDAAPREDGRVQKPDATPLLADQGPTERDAAPDALPLDAVVPGLDAAGGPDAVVPRPTDAAAPAPDAAVGECQPGRSRLCEHCPGVRQVCVEGLWSQCRGPEETCNGVDDDCDGLVDEGPDGNPLQLVCYDGPPGTGGEGECRAGVRLCENGAFGACVGEVLPAVETCDGRDNDCDGQIDDAADGAALSSPCYDGPAGTNGLGVCHGGTRLCQGGLPSACIDQVLPAREICDGVDNNCNGAVDDADTSCDCVPGTEQHCYSGAPGTEGIGACRSGTQFCDVTGHFAVCVGDRGPEPELCDGQDNDCNGTVDDGVSGAGQPCEQGLGVCATVGEIVCDSVSGSLSCSAHVPAGGAELCNDLDDNCDGRVDETYVLGAPCTHGVGECAVAGVTRCTDDGLSTVCSALPGQPGNEICDGRDNDCDGVADNGLDLGAPCTLGIGACAATGQRVCGADGTVVCSAAPLAPGRERCNGIDDNCDGQIDEADPQLGQACGTGQPGLCGTGALACPDGVLRCMAVVQPVAELCDGLDNDCDGRTDNAPDGTPLQRACYDGAAGTEGVGPCASGQQSCIQGQFGVCLGQVVPSPEACDGRDNNCDGPVDNLDAGVCRCQPGQRQACYGGPAGTQNVGVCVGGQQTCLADGSGFGPCNGEVTPQAEACDTLDDDCNGVTDDPAGFGVACESGQGECARPGVFVCDPLGGGLICDAMPGAAGPEICDGVDNDCNGRVDDPAGLGGFCRAADPNGGVCQPEGSMQCVPGRGAALVCVALANPAPERCNGVDDNNNLCVDENIVDPTGAACTVGIGECARSGVTTCQGPAGVACNVSPAGPSVELCDGRDNNCDGRIDDNPDDAGRACVSGVGACARNGLTTCNNGVLGCSAVPGNPAPEACDQIDNNCDGRVDEGGVCDIYASCLAARNAGRNASGVTAIRPPGFAASVNVYCDQTNDGGGWTLVGSTLDATLNDQSSAWYADLQTLAPAQGNAGVWNGLRPLGGHWDVRFACRDAVQAADAPMTVDLSFYDVPWYWEMTTGTDTDSCFSEDNGIGADAPVPARRNNLSGASLAVGAPYTALGGAYIGAHYLEGEDTCSDTGDFTVDFADRGMDSDQSDGTDWGEDDTAMKCGRSGLNAGQWFVFARELGGPAPSACAGEDMYEENDSQGTATPTQVAVGANAVIPNLLICGTESDWFAFDAPGGCTYTAAIDFIHANGDLDLSLSNPAGTVLTSSTGVANRESVTYTVPVGQMPRLGVRVYGYSFASNSHNTYTLTVSKTCP